MKKFLQGLSRVLRMVRLLFPSILFILLCMILFSTLPQGQDVLLMAAEYPQNSLLFLLAVTFFALVNWYTSRLIVYIKEEKNKGYRQEVLEAHGSPAAAGGTPVNDKFWFNIFPRILGYASFFAVEVALISHPYFKNMYGGWLTAIMFAAQTGIYIAVYYYFKKRKHEYHRGTFWVMLGIIFLLISLPLFIEGDRSLSKNLMTLFVLTGILKVAFLIWNHLRRQKIEADSAGLKNQKTIGFNRLKVVTLPEKEVPFFITFNIIALIPLAVYIGSLCSVNLAIAIQPFNIAMLGLSVLVGFLQLISMVTIRLRINFHFIVFVLAIALAAAFNPYELRKKETQAKVYDNRMTLKAYAEKWFDQRKGDMVKASPENKYTVYFVLSDGGASRSGYWVAETLGKLQDTTKGKFAKQLFCLSGASGGSVGNGVFYTLLNHALEQGSNLPDTFSYYNESRRFLKNDFLSYTLSHMIGADYFRYIVTHYLMQVDRGEALELSMENPENSHFLGKFFEREYKEYITAFNKYPGQLPALFINTTRENDANPAVISNIITDSTFSARLDVLNILDTSAKKPYGSINFSSAVVMGARFPYISPAVGINNQYFVDGGYFDNSGAGVVMEMLVFLQNMLKQPAYDDIRDKVEFHIIHASNSERGIPEEFKPLHPMVNDLATPILTLAGSYSQQTNTNNQRLYSLLKTYFNNGKSGFWTTVNLYDGLNKLDDRNSFSMNWVISDTTLNRMDALVYLNDSLKSLIKKFGDDSLPHRVMPGEIALH